MGGSTEATPAGRAMRRSRNVDAMLRRIGRPLPRTAGDPAAAGVATGRAGAVAGTLAGEAQTVREVTPLED